MKRLLPVPEQGECPADAALTLGASSDSRAINAQSSARADALPGRGAGRLVPR